MAQRQMKVSGFVTPFLIIALLGGVFALVTSAAAQDDRKKPAGPVEYVCPPCEVDCHDETFSDPGICPDPSCGMTLVSQSLVRNVAIVIWNGAEVLDFAGPTEVFASARGDDGSYFNVYTVAASAEPILSQGVVRVIPEYTIENCPQPDIFVLPGGGTNSPLSNPKMIEWVKRVSVDAEISMSVCTGAFVLARAGLLEGKEATTWHGAINGLRMLAPNTIVHDDQRWVDNGSVVTSAGVSAGIDASLHIVARLCGEEVAQSTAEYMEYDWRPHEVTGRIASPGGQKTFSLGQQIVQTLLQDGLDAGWETYHAALGTEREGELPSERDINRVGYGYLQEGESKTAITFFIFNIKAHPDAFNTYDSLGEAYMKAGQREKAIMNFRKSLELNPENENATEMLKKLEAD